MLIIIFGTFSEGKTKIKCVIQNVEPFHNILTTVIGGLCKNLNIENVTQGKLGSTTKQD
jgi:hypothetical protein